MNPKEFLEAIKPLADKWKKDLIKDGLFSEDDVLNKNTKHDPRGYVWRYVDFDEIIQEGDQMYVDWDKFDVKSKWIECFNYVGKKPYMYPNILFRTKRPLS